MHPSLRGIRGEKREPDEERGDGTQPEFREHVAGHAPVLLEDTVCAFPDLRGEGHGVGAAAGFFGDVEGLCFFFFVEGVDLLLDFFCAGAGVPDFVPGLAVVVFARVDDLEHVFRGVLVFATFAGAGVFEVLEQSLGVLADVAEVDGFASFGEEEESVEFLEEDGAGLMDCAENCLSGGGQLLEE